MYLQTYLPAPALRPFIRSYLVLESDAALVNRVLPNAGLVMALRYKGDVQYVDGPAPETLPNAVFTGLRQSVRLIHYTGNTGNILIQFTPTGAAAFCKMPLHEVFGHSVLLQELLPTATLEAQIMEASDDTTRITLVDQFFLSQLLINNKPDALVQAAVQHIQHTQGTGKIKALAQNLYISADAFEKRFRRVVGASPKQYAAIIRMHSILQQGAENLAGSAFAAGYFDMPHFNKDFKRFTGLTPTQYFKLPPRW